MSIRRVGVLLKKEFIHGSTSYFFIFAIVGPLLFTLVVNLLFGSLFSSSPSLGTVGPGRSRVVELLKDMESIDVKEYAREADLKRAIEVGAQDVGVIFQKGFDDLVAAGKPAKLTVYVWGESHLKDRALINGALLSKIREVSGKQTPVEITAVTLGDVESVPWKDRFLPILALMAIFIAGFTIPSSSLVEEKQKRTIVSVLTTPVTQGEIFTAKGLTAFFLSITMGVTTLALNRAFGAQLPLMILLLFCGAVMACCFGLLLGAFMKDTATLYSAIKGFGLIIYGPGVVAVFPQIPEWIGKCFPTYYVINPIMAIAREGGGWSTVNGDVLVLVMILCVSVALVGIAAKKTNLREA